MVARRARAPRADVRVPQLKRDLCNMRDAPLDMFMDPKQFPDMQTKERIQGVQGINNILREVRVCCAALLFVCLAPLLVPLLVT